MRVGLSGSWMVGRLPARRAEMSEFIEIKSLCALLSLMCLYYCSFRLYSFRFSLILFGNWPKPSLSGVLLCALIWSPAAQPFSIRERWEDKIDISHTSWYLGFRMWFGGCQSQVEQSLELNQQAEGVKKEEAGIHFVLQIRLKFHLPLLPRHTPPCPPHLPFPFPPSTTQSYFPSYLNSEGTSAIRLLCPWIGEDPLEE